jgi:hypothetical protein
MSVIGNNVKAEVNGDTLTLTIDLSVDGTESKSGKSTVLGTTQGNKKVPYGDGEVTIGVNVYKPSVAKKGDL